MMTRIKWVLPNTWNRDKIEKAKALALRTKSLRHYMNPKQREIYDMFWKDDCPLSFGVYVSRKNGKSVVGYLISCEFAVKYNNTIVRYICDTTKQARDVIFDIHNQLREILPKEFVPQLKVADSKLVFKNGSEIILGGSNRNNIETSRGGRTDLFIFDEIAAWDSGDDYNYALRSILLPQRAMSPHKRRIDLTTPPKNPAHDWVVGDYMRYKETGRLISWDIDENPMLDDKEVQTIIDEDYGGDPLNPDFLREHKLHLIPETSRIVCPEYKDEEHSVDGDAMLTKWLEDGYRLRPLTITDYGATDWTATVVYVQNLDTDELLAVEELTVLGSPSDFDIQYKALRAKYNKLLNYPEWDEVMDCMMQARQMFREEPYGIDFSLPRKKRLKVDSVLFLRDKFRRNKIYVNKTCKLLRSMLQLGMWAASENENKKFERTDTLKHLDHLDTLVYAALYITWGGGRPTDLSQLEIGRPR